MPAILPPAVRPVIGHALLSRAVAREETALVPERVEDDERLPFVTGFADIVVTLGIAPFVGAASWLGRDAPGETGGRALGIVLLTALAAPVADRRAIPVAGLTHAGIARGTLIRDAGFTSRAVPSSFLALGAFVLLLGAGRRAMRGLVLRGLPARPAARLPHPIGAR